MADALSKNKRMADAVRKYAKEGILKTEAFELCKTRFNDAPRAYRTFLKLYNADWLEAIGEDTSVAKSALMKNIEEGDQRAIEYHLDRRAGWAKKTSEDEVSDAEEEETEGYMKELLQGLGFDTEEKT